MYYIFGESIDNFLGYFLLKSKQLKVDESLRGWSASKEIEPIAKFQLPVYVVAGKYCPTARDVYLRYVEKKKMKKTKALIIGILLHETMSRIIPTAKKYIYEYGEHPDFNLLDDMLEMGKRHIDDIINKNDTKLLTDDELNSIRENMLKLWNFQTKQIVASVEQVLSKFLYIEPDSLVTKAIPFSVENKLDGSRIGLSKNLSVDALHIPETVVMDIKTGKPQEFHDLTVAGYALAYESEYKNPVNLGCILYPQFLKNKPVPLITKEPFLIDNELRRKFIAERNKKMQIILDKRDPGVPEHCPRSCGFYEICHG